MRPNIIEKQNGHGSSGKLTYTGPSISLSLVKLTVKKDMDFF
jgi:hypothetical protein